MMETAFVVAGTVCVGCFAVLAGGACPGRLAEARDGELLFLSEYMTICQQSAVFATVPWALAYAVAASMVCVLASWVRAGACALSPVARGYSLTMHMLTFHFCFSVACVVEFRTDGTAPVPHSFLPPLYGDEAFAHKISALQAIVDFACIHLIIAAHVCGKGERDGLGRLGLAGYRAAEVVYACATYLFLVCWLMQRMLAAAAFEWVLVGCALLMQWYAVRRCGAGAKDAGPSGALAERAPLGPVAAGADDAALERAPPLVGLFRERHFEALLGAYVLLNVLAAVVFSEVRWEAAGVGEAAPVSTGPEFWALVALAAGAVGACRAAGAGAGAGAERARAALAY
jgi:hypothetical protein